MAAALRGSGSGWVVNRTWSTTYSLGSRLTHGTSSRRPLTFLSSRHMTSGIQPRPPSVMTTLRVGNRSKTPWQTRLITFAWNTWLSPVCHST